MWKLLIVMIFFIHLSSGEGWFDEAQDEYLWPRQSAPNTEKECIRDILVLWDNSNSLGWTGFGQVVQFLKTLVKDKRLRTGGKDGTQFEFFSFSTNTRVKSMRKFRKTSSKQDYLNWLTRVNYLDWNGRATRTGLAFKEVNNKILKNDNPKNYRTQYPDVLLLFTDGLPNSASEPLDPEGSERFLVSKYSKKLMAKNITIIGLGAGPKFQNKANFDSLKEWTTYAFSASLSHLATVLDHIVTSACKARPGAQCTCDFTTQASPIQYVKKGQQALVTVKEPKLTCPFPSKIIKSPGPYQNTLGAGLHSINFKISYEDEDKKPKTKVCTYNITVKDCACPKEQTVVGKLKPNDKDVFVTWKEPKPTKECKMVLNKKVLNSGYFSSSSRKEYVYTNKDITLKCYVNIKIDGQCRCASQPPVTKYVKSGELASVKLQKLDLICPGNPKISGPTVSPTGGNIQKLREGTHSISYTYGSQYVGGKIKTYICTYRINVQGCSCPKEETITKQLPLGATSMLVSWNEPTPNCPMRKTSGMNPNTMLSAGSRRLEYVYQNKDLTLKCYVTINIKDTCGTQKYNPTYEECCCGEKYQKQPNHGCCGKIYYSKSRKTCCSDKKAILLPRGQNCPVQA